MARPRGYVVWQPNDASAVLLAAASFMAPAC